MSWVRAWIRPAGAPAAFGAPVPGNISARHAPESGTSAPTPSTAAHFAGPARTAPGPRTAPAGRPPRCARWSAAASPADCGGSPAPLRPSSAGWSVPPFEFATFPDDLIAEVRRTEHGVAKNPQVGIRHWIAVQEYRPSRFEHPPHLQQAHGHHREMTSCPCREREPVPQHR